jgi:hypothetical protein
MEPRNRIAQQRPRAHGLIELQICLLRASRRDFLDHSAIHLPSCGVSFGFFIAVQRGMLEDTVEI